MMEIGISTASFFLKKYVEDSFETIKNLGCEVVEVFLTTFSEYKKEFADMLATRTEGLRIHSVHSLNQHYEPELYNKSPRTYFDAEQIMRDVLYCGKKLGATCYSFHGPSRLKNKPYNVDFSTFGARTEHLNDICKEYGVTLCYENVHWTYFSYPEFYSKLKEYAPGVRCTLDTKQAIQSGRSISDYVKIMGKDIKTVHLCDVYGDKTCMPGKGDIDFCALFEHLAKLGVDAPLLLEVYSGDYDDYDQLALSLDYLRDCLRRVLD